MKIKRLPDGKLIVPCRAEGDGGVVGDGMVEIGPDDPDYPAWDKWLKANPDEEERDKPEELTS